MTSRKAAFVAIPAGPEDDKVVLSSCEYQIISESEKDDEVYMPTFKKFKNCSLILGLLVGFFIQFSTLGANFLVITLWGQEVITKSKTEVVIFSLVWSFFTSFMAIVILGFLRALISMVFNTTDTNGRRESRESMLEELVLHMECRFVVGALVGVCIAWTMTDVLLGMKAQIIYSVITLGVALLWCRIMMWLFTRNEKSLINDSEEPIALVSEDELSSHQPLVLL